VGEVLLDEAEDCVGTPVVLAWRLFERATAARFSAVASGATMVRGAVENRPVANPFP
jgi:hypothetical protein